ncbi:unnamed protein product [Periconia digitata]|uniref:Uncharacterized protein n=1 Tax=Periconia digitata TaxID=1303443 RepID=A0A9W4U462_9PLEO|nr:unnamed protein product [Periconia digitata]
MPVCAWSHPPIALILHLLIGGRAAINFHYILHGWVGASYSWLITTTSSLPCT